MISFDDFRPVDGKPIYLQILEYIKRGAVAGIIRDGDELPSRRVLSALLGINPNTVQKAFKTLEDEDLITSRAGAKSFMTLDGEKLRHLRAELLEDTVSEMVRKLREMGLSKEEALHLLSERWEKEE